MDKVCQKAKIEGYKGIEPVGSAPFIFVQMINSQWFLPIVEVNSVVLDLIRDEVLVSIPIHVGQEVRPGTLICFETNDLEGSNESPDFDYAIVQSTEYYKNGSTFGERMSFVLARFQLIPDISEIIVF